MCLLVYVFTSLLVYYIIKDTDAQSDEEVHRVSSRRVPSAGASVLVELRCTILLTRECVPLPGSSLHPVLLGFL